jgi:hypothetical protein
MIGRPVRDPRTDEPGRGVALPTTAAIGPCKSMR